MAIPVPRSYEQILADILDSFITEAQLDNKVQIGGPLLSIIEAVAQSQLKSSQDTFNMLDSLDIDRADLPTLQEIAKSENVSNISTVAATGFVTIYDTSFSKISTNIYSGVNAVNPGSLTIKVVDASSFPNSGSLYIGRNTSNYEGPLPYTSKTQVGNYWEITLATNTVKFHNTGESVVLAQGGVRKIKSDTIVQTLQGNLDDAISFSLLYDTQIEDGETEVTGVEVVAKERGTIGNIPANAIKEVVGNPFLGASATNPLPFTNGLPDQDETSLRNAIKKARQNRTKGTDQALLNAINGVSSPEENKTVIGSSIINRKNIYIDDGLGYEEIVEGVSQEVLVNSALGTEQFFQLQNVPVAKAFLKTELEAPFNIIPGQSISFRIGGKLSSHTFSSSDFRDPSNATAYEVVASINSNSGALFNAKTSDQAKKVCVFSKLDKNEDIEIVANGADANPSLRFPSGIQYTLRLYKNDQLLYEDGQYAIVESVPQNKWNNSITNGETLLVQVDGGAVQTITINDTDFIKYQTGFNTVKSTNSVAAWAKVLNKKITGATVKESLNLFYIQSNLGTNSEASLNIVGGSLVTKGMFLINSNSQGRNNDYVLNRNTGQIKLNKQLSKGDSLVASTTFTRAYVQGAPLQAATTTFNSPAKLWFTVDSDSEIIPTKINSSTAITVNNQYGSNIARLTTSTLNAFGSSEEDAIKAGDWMILWDPNSSLQGIFRVSSTVGSASNYSWIEVASYTPFSTYIFSPTSQGVAFVRSPSRPFEIKIPTGTYSLFDIKNYVNQNYKNVFFDIYKNTQARIQTNSLDPDLGKILLVTLNTEAYKLLFTLNGGIKSNSYPHLAYVQSGNSQIGTPRFKWDSVLSKDSTSFSLSRDVGANGGDFLYIPKSLDTSSERRDSFFSMYSDILSNKVSNTYTPRNLDTNLLTPNIDRVLFMAPFNIGPEDDWSVLVDRDQENKKYDINLFKNAVFAPGTNYGNSTLQILDADNSQSNFYNSLGDSTDFFNDFSFNLQAKGKSHSVVANKTILWRSSKYGAEGNLIRLAYTNPSAPNSSLELSTNSNNGFYNVNIGLPSGPARTGMNINTQNYFIATAGVSYSGLPNRTSNVVKISLSGLNMTYNLSPGDYVYQTSNITNFPIGPKKITTVNSDNFSYSETGANASSATQLVFNIVPKPAGFLHTITSLQSIGSQITVTIGSHSYNVGDIVYFSPGIWDPVGNINAIYGNKTIVSTTPTTITWSETTTAGTAILNPNITYTISPSSATKVTINQYTSLSPAGLITRSGNYVSAAVALVNGISQHPYNVGDIVYLTTNEPNFPSGPKIVISRTTTNFDYYEAGADATSTINHTFSSTATQPNFSSIIAGDIVNLTSDTAFNFSSIAGIHKTVEVKPTSFSFLILGTGITTPSIPQKLNSLNNLVFYPINTSASKASDIVSWVSANASDIVSATLVPNNGGSTNNGSGVITTATTDEYLTNTLNGSINGTNPTSLRRWSLFDGVNFVKQTNINSANTTIALKTPVAGELVSNSDTNNDKIRLTPITTQGLVRYLSSLSVSGLGANTAISSSNNGNSLQINSKSIGSDGSIQVLGGSANSAYATVIGSGEAVGGYSRVKTYAGQTKGFNVNSFVELQNSIPTQKNNNFSPTTVFGIQSTSDSSQWTVTSTGMITVKQSISSSNRRYQVEKHGNYMAYIDISNSPTSLSATIVSGDWVNIQSPAFSSANTGLKQVVAIDPAKNTFWVKNPEGIDEVIQSSSLCITFISYDSPVPGDSLNINSSKFNKLNVGRFSVIDFVYPSNIKTNPLSVDSVLVSGNMATDSVTLETDYLLVNFVSENPLSLIKTLRGKVPDIDGLYVDFILDSPSYIEKITSGSQASIRALDKLEFNTNINTGSDGYKYNTGLLAEVNKVLYGDESNPTIYPGYVAAGADISISGCIIKRISIALAVKTAFGNSDLNLAGRIKSTVASVVNSTIIGQSIAISDIVSAVNNIDGVFSVVIISPEYNSLNDLIALQPNEKPKILDLDQDIFITFN